MRISKPSIPSLVLPALLCSAVSAPAQDGARPSIADEGAASLDRLEDAIARSQGEAARLSDPQLPRMDAPEDHRRAFEALRNRAPSPAMEQRARAAQARGEASLAAERERQAKALRQALGLEPGEEQAIARPARNFTAKGWVPVLFVSSSMPISTLRNYAAQLERVNGVMAFRGAPGGLRKMEPMARLTAQILRLDPGCEGPGCRMRAVQLIIDPIVFRQHSIAQVPALAMIPGDPTQAYCERDEDSPRARHVVTGDSALSGMFEAYARLGGKEEVSHAQALLVDR
ncbi:conjugal transfer protein TrbC [Novosphingobium profundi]|uniref:type-F conjugative transfer system pilin assembly protein TrbC n=1 Tax=Novosphingobium profundi TaxID=1774954 RepID=UPI001BD998E5|nr:type-F conjugative transfer system pilin assembly protein TrbC [Novosphingobium profundi]MBT0667380.1 conjugal transfer protein TrbC [Novosphingobium profundi]